MLTRIFAAAVFALLTSAATVKAATIDFSGINSDMGTVTVGQNGTITTIPLGQPLLFANGFLPAFTQITLTYTLTAGDFSLTVPRAVGTLNYNSPWSSAEFGAVAIFVFDGTVPGGGGIGTGGGAFNSSANPVVLSLDGNGLISAGGEFIDAAHTAITLANVTAKASGFATWLVDDPELSGVAAAGFSTYSVSDVSQISAVPLPAALPLFGSGVMMLAGVAWRRRGKVSA